MSFKLRASCDGCHKAKVKCTAGVAGCVRCKTMNKDCLYSPALPRMSQKNRMVPSNESESNSPPAASPSVHQGNHTPLRPSTSSQSQSPGPLLSDNMEFLCSDSLNFDLTDMRWSSWEVHGNPTDQVSVSGSLPSDAVFSQIPSHLSAASIPSSNDLGPDYSQVPSNSSTDLDSPQVNPTNWCSPLLGSLRDPSTNLVSHVDHPGPDENQQKPQQDHKRGCNCLSKLLLALKIVHKNPTVAVDVAFRANREAVACCWSLINCSCTNKLSLVIIACGLLELVLNSYQSAFESFCGGADECSLASTPKSRPVEVTLGGFGIEKEDQRFFLSELVTRGIRKIESTLLPAFYPAIGLEAHDLHEALISHLSQKSKAIIGELQNYRFG